MAIVLSAFFCASFASEAQAQGLEYGNAVWVVDEGDIMSCPEGTPAHIDIESGSDNAEMFFSCCGHWEQEVSGGGQVHTNIIIPGFGVASPTGSPALPARGFWVVIDRGVDPVLSQASIAEAVSVPIYPVLPVQPDHNEDDPAPSFEKDAAVYGQDILFPAESGEMIYTGFGGETHYAFVVVNPVKYNPVSGELRVATSLTLNLDLSDVTGPIVPYIGSITRGEYLIIVDDTVYANCTDGSGKNLIDDFARWKTQKGFQSVIYLTSEIPNFISDPEHSNYWVGSFLQGAWDTWAPRPSYLLLIGEHPDVPSNYAWPDPIGHPDFRYATDFPYSLLEGGDTIPDLMMGRLPAGTGADCAAALGKILKYDRNPDLGDWYDNNLFAAKFQDGAREVGDFRECSVDTDCAALGLEFSCEPSTTTTKSYCVKTCGVPADCWVYNNYEYCNYSDRADINIHVCHLPRQCRANANYMDIVASLTDFFDIYTSRTSETVLTTDVKANSEVSCINSHYPWITPDYRSYYANVMPDGYTSYVILPFNNDDDYSTESIEAQTAIQIAEINTAFETTGVGLVMHRDHGGLDSSLSGSNWKWPRYNQADAYSLTNSPETPLVFGINCSNSKFAEYDPTSTFDNPLIDANCIGESFINNPVGGAVAVIGPTYNSSTKMNNKLMQGAVSSIWPDYSIAMSYYSLPNLGNKQKRMGKILDNMKAYLESIHPTDFRTKTHRELYHLFGDPEMYYRPSTPLNRSGEFDYNSPIMIGDFGFHIDHNLVPSDLDYALASLSRVNDSGDLEKVGSGEFLSGGADIALFGVMMEPDVWTLTITHYSMKPYVVEIPVCINVFDCDGDGVPNLYDNCWLEPNADQGDCDEDGDGNACDDDICVDFCDLGTGAVDDIESYTHILTSPFGQSYINYAQTPSEIDVTYCAHGAALESNEAVAQELEHEVQLRWCSCEGFAASFSGQYLCEQNNCPKNEYGTEALQFNHSGWHLASRRDTVAAIGPIPYPQSNGGCDDQMPLDPYNDYAPSATCGRSTDWSQWRLDQTLLNVTGPTPDYCTFHCSPGTPVWENPGPGPVGDVEIAWDWNRELWWDAITPSTADVLVGNEGYIFNALTGTTTPAWGFLWLRPPGPEIDSGDPMGRGWTETGVNKYNTFHTHPPTITSSGFTAICHPSLPTIYDFIPWDMFFDSGMGMGMPLDALGPEIVNDMSYISSPSIAMSIIPPEASVEAGAFAYADGLVRGDAALGGLTVTFIDGGRLDARAGGYSTGSAMGSVPDTIGFAHTRFGWGGEQGVAGLAVFGGMLRSGQKDGSLWIGEYGGLDADGVPFIEWGNVTPLSGEMPDPRSGAALVFDESGRGLVLFGGELDNGQPATDMWAYHLERESWSQIDLGFPGLNDFQAVQYRGAVYIAGGTDANGVVNSLVYKLSLDDFSTLVVASLADGPGSRDHVAIGFDESRMGQLVFYGGSDPNGAGHNDLWEYDLETGTWSMRKDDCLDEGCPQPGARSFIVVGYGGRRTAVYGPVDDRGNRFFLLDDENNEWIGNVDRARAMEPSVLDCDGDGVAEEETTLACRSSDEWYAEVGRMECMDPGQSDLLTCGAKEPEPMTPSASWSPGGWEWIVDLAEGPDDYTYVLTDDKLYTFDTLDLSGGLYPIDSDELIVPGSCWFCGGPDWSFDVKVEGGYAMVGSWSGVHVFDLSDPSSPVEVGHFASYGPVVDIAAFDGLVYLADGFGVTVLSLFDPSAPQELGRAPLGTFVEAIGVNADNRNLMALTPGSLRRLEISVDATKPVQTASVGLAGWAFWSMKVYGEWTYLNGPWTQTVLDNRTGDLEKRGPHDVRSWVGGRILRDDRAQRVKWLFNTFQVWEE